MATKVISCIIRYLENNPNPNLTLKNVEDNLVRYLKLKNCDQNMLPFPIIFRSGVGDRITDIFKLFSKYKIKVTTCKSSDVMHFISKNENKTIMEVITILESDELCYNILCRHNDLKHDLLINILKYAIINIDFNLDNFKHVYIICTFINKYNYSDAFHYFDKIFIKKLFESTVHVNIAKIFGELLSSKNIYSDDMLKLLLKGLNFVDISVSNIFYEFKASCIKKNPKHTFRITKITTLIKYLVDNNKIPSDEVISNILSVFFHNSNDDTLDILLDLKFYPTNLTILNNRGCNNIFEKYVTNYIENIKLTEQIKMLMEKK